MCARRTGNIRKSEAVIQKHGLTYVSPADAYRLESGARAINTAGIDPSGLTRLQRERMLKKQSKGTLRAA